MQKAIDDAKEGNRIEICATLLLHKGITLACYSEDSSHADQDIQAWEECSQMILSNTKHQSVGAILLDKVRRQMSCYYFTATPGKKYSEKLKQVFENQKGVVHGMSAAKTYSAAEILRRGNRPGAQELLKENMEEACNLSDGTTRNDNRGFTLLFQIFLYTGDRINALIAFSLLARRELDEEILQIWLQSDDGALSPEATELIEFFRKTCAGNYDPWISIWEMKLHLRLSQKEYGLTGELASTSEYSVGKIKPFRI